MHVCVRCGLGDVCHHARGLVINLIIDVRLPYPTLKHHFSELS